MMLAVDNVDNCKIHLEEGKALTTPGRTPPAPRPAMTLPNMNAMEFGAAPQRAEPASNSSKDVKKVVLTGRNL